MPTKQQALADLLALFNAGRPQMGIRELTGQELERRLAARRAMRAEMPTDTPGRGMAPPEAPSGAPDQARPYAAFEDQREAPIRAPMHTEAPSRPYAQPMPLTEAPSGPPTAAFAAGQDQRPGVPAGAQASRLDPALLELLLRSKSGM